MISISAVTVLIVEDDEDIREALAQILEDEGYRIVTAPNGKVGMEQLRDHLPRLILLDLMMPVMNGWQFRQHQLADAALAGIPVVVVSADGSASREAVRMGAADFVQKPVDLEALLRIVASHCRPA